MLSYMYYGWEPWSMPAWIPAVEFLPFFALLAYEAWRARATGRQVEPTVL
jgi:hypothetical protein